MKFSLTALAHALFDRIAPNAVERAKALPLMLPSGAMTLEAFVREHYMPYLADQRPGTKKQHAEVFNARSRKAAS